LANPARFDERRVARTLQATEKAGLDAEKNHDAATFEEIVPYDWIAITPDGKRQTKTERAAEIKNGHIDSATLGAMKVRAFGDTAVVTGTDDETTKVGGKKSTDHYVWSDVFVKRNGQWVTMASQTAGEVRFGQKCHPPFPLPLFYSVRCIPKVKAPLSTSYGIEQFQCDRRAAPPPSESQGAARADSDTDRRRQPVRSNGDARSSGIR